MLDFDSATSLDQDVFEYMTKNKMYEMVSSSEDTSIDFALQRIGRSLMKVSPKEAVEKLCADGRQKHVMFTVIVEECVWGIRRLHDRSSSGYVYPANRKTTRSHKVCENENWFMRFV